MGVTKAFSFIIVLVFLGIPAHVSGQSIQQCLNDYLTAATRITDVNEICDLTKTYLRCVFKDLTLTPELRSQLKTQLEETFRKANVQCDESVDEMIRYAETGRLPDSGEKTTQRNVDDLTPTTKAVDTIPGQSIQQCLRDYINAATRITDINEMCDLSKTYLRCVFSYYRDNGITLNSSQRSQLKEQIERSFSQANVQCDESAEEMIRYAETGRLPDSGEKTTQRNVDDLTPTTKAVDTIPGQSIQQCLRDYINAATRITDINEMCDLSKTYLRCVFSYYRDNGITLTSSQRSQLKEQIERSFSQANVQCDESAEEMIRFAETGSKNGSIKMSGALSGLTLLAVVISALMGTLY